MTETTPENVTIAPDSCGVTAGYMPGFGNGFETESLPVGRNSPQRVNYGLYAEQLSGSPFTASKSSLECSWMYRIRPSVKHVSSFAVVGSSIFDHLGRSIFTVLTTPPARAGSRSNCAIPCCL